VSSVELAKPNPLSQDRIPALQLCEGGYLPLQGMHFWGRGSYCRSKREHSNLVTLLQFCYQAGVPVDGEIVLRAHRPPFGWYPDPDGPSQQRWWDGLEWADPGVPQAPFLTRLKSELRGGGRTYPRDARVTLVVLMLIVLFLVLCSLVFYLVTGSLPEFQ
jgi:hypothetical protein